MIRRVDFLRNEARRLQYFDELTFFKTIETIHFSILLLCRDLVLQQSSSLVHRSAKVDHEDVSTPSFGRLGRF
jgi:hypothetical protein